MDLPTASDLRVEQLGPCRLSSPLVGSDERFIPDSQRVLLCRTTDELQPYLDKGEAPPSFESAGPRPRIFFDPKEVTCGIVTCGGLCPGVNNVIRSLVLTLTHHYGVTRILGFRFGFAGLCLKSEHQPLQLSTQLVINIHKEGGSVLGSSRGPQDYGEMVDALVQRKVGILFTIGGDGTLRGAAGLVQEIARRQLPIAVIGIPKTIDNDLQWTSVSFGFATAVEEANRAIVAAHCEAVGAWNGIGLVKLMGRHSGFIAAHASLSNNDVNFCLVPEVPFTLHGKGGFLEALEERMDNRHHAAIVVAEGAGQEMLQDPSRQERDASGNLRLKDIGVFLRDEIASYFARRGKEVTIKYIDPSYTIRSLPANSMDSEYCLMLGQNAVHAGMTGRTNMLVGYWDRQFTHVPIPVAVGRRKQLDPTGPIWHGVLEGTGQPASLVGEE